MTIVCSFKSSSKKVFRGNQRSVAFETKRTYETVVQRRRKVVQVQPDIERADGGNLDLESKLLESVENVISLRLEVFLQGHLRTIVPW
jgi:hypothetical protein